MCHLPRLIRMWVLPGYWVQCLYLSACMPNKCQECGGSSVDVFWMNTLLGWGSNRLSEEASETQCWRKGTCPRLLRPVQRPPRVVSPLLLSLGVGPELYQEGALHLKIPTGSQRPGLVSQDPPLCQIRDKGPKEAGKPDLNAFTLKGRPSGF